jgi:hypothetical protein
MKWRALHELTPWDERTIFRLREGRKMGGTHAEQDWSRILSEFRSPPPPPTVTIEIGADALLLHPVGPATQLELGAIAASLPNLRVTNARDTFDPRLPFELWPLIGSDAFTKSNSWRRRLWQVPLEFARDGQPYPRGFEGLCASLAEEAEQPWQVGDIGTRARDAIAATLAGDEATEFWRTNR